MIRDKGGENMVEDVIIPEYTSSTHCLWNIAYEECSMTGFREEWGVGSSIVEQLSCEERQNWVGIVKADKQMAEGVQ